MKDENIIKNQSCNIIAKNIVSADQEKCQGFSKRIYLNINIICCLCNDFLSDKQQIIQIDDLKELFEQLILRENTQNININIKFKIFKNMGKNLSQIKEKKKIISVSQKEDLDILIKNISDVEILAKKHSIGRLFPKIQTDVSKLYSNCLDQLKKVTVIETENNEDQLELDNNFSKIINDIIENILIKNNKTFSVQTQLIKANLYKTDSVNSILKENPYLINCDEASIEAAIAANGLEKKINKK